MLITMQQTRNVRISIPKRMEWLLLVVVVFVSFVAVQILLLALLQCNNALMIKVRGNRNE